MRIEYQSIYGIGPAKPCSHCDQEIAADAISCDHCQRTQSEYGEYVQGTQVVVVPQNQMPTHTWPGSIEIGKGLYDVETHLKMERRARGKEGLAYDLIGRKIEEYNVRQKINRAHEEIENNLIESVVEVNKAMAQGVVDLKRRQINQKVDENVATTELISKQDRRFIAIKHISEKYLKSGIFDGLTENVRYELFMEAVKKIDEDIWPPLILEEDDEDDVYVDDLM